MRNCLSSILFAVIMITHFNIQAQDGFVVWSEGTDCDKELRFSAFKGEVLGPSQVAVKKGKGVDVLVQISHDGVWLVWCRSDSIFNSRYGRCGYDVSENFNIYVAKINNGTTLPAKAIKVDHGLWPTWAMDENAKDPSKPKLLYYSRYSDSTIRKAVINPDGSVAQKNVLYVNSPYRIWKSRPHVAVSPNGRYISVYRKNLYDLQTKAGIPESDGVSYHPVWGPRSRYIMHSQNGVTGVEDGKIFMPRIEAGVGKYWAGISNDAYYDQGKMWIIGKTGSSSQRNRGGVVEFKEVDIRNGGWKYGEGIKVTNLGSSCDIHINPPATVTFPRVSDRAVVEPTVTTFVNGGFLNIESQDCAVNSVELFNTQGERVIFKKVAGFSKNTIPLNTIANGTYIVKINNGKESFKKSIAISR